MIHAVRTTPCPSLHAPTHPKLSRGRPGLQRCHGTSGLRVDVSKVPSTAPIEQRQLETPSMPDVSRGATVPRPTQPTAQPALALCKAWYFLAGTSGVFFYPYLNMYLSQHGMTGPQIGLLSALRPWISAPLAMASTSISDQYKCHRQVLVTSFVAATVLRVSIVGASSAGIMFWLLLVGELLGAPINVISDSTVLSHCPQDSDFGQQRLWGSLGFGACSVLAGWLIAHHGLDAAFAVFALLSIPMGLVALQLPYNYPLAAHKQQRQHLEAAFKDAAGQPAVSEGVQTRGRSLRQRHQQQLPAAAEPAAASPGVGTADTAAGAAQSAGDAGSGIWEVQGMKQVLMQPHVALFLWRAMLMGFGLGVMNTYEFMYLKTLGAPETLMGVAMLLACCTEVPAFQFQGKILDKVPLDNVLHLVLLTISLRMGLYAVLPAAGNVWVVLPVELLHGITYALAFGVGTLYASQVAPPGRGASMQGVFQATYLSIGGGLGGLLGGVLLESHGGSTLFGVSAALVLLGWAGALVVEGAMKFTAKKH